MVGTGQFWMAFTFPLSISVLCLLMKYPRKEMVDLWNSHFSNLRYIWYSLYLRNVLLDAERKVDGRMKP